MRVIGIDPGFVRTGYGVVGQGRGGLVVEGFGTLQAPGGTASEQLRSLHERLGEILADHRPDVMAIERLFVTRNQRTAIRVGQASGVALLAAAECGIPVAEYGPLEVKQAVVGVGNATKAQVGFMVSRLLGLAGGPGTTDAADALALAICHLHSYRLDERAVR